MLELIIPLRLYDLGAIWPDQSLGGTPMGLGLEATEIGQLKVTLTANLIHSRFLIIGFQVKPKRQGKE